MSLDSIRPRQSPAFSAEELFEVLDMIPGPAADINNQEAVELARAILVQAIADFLAPRQSLMPPAGLAGSYRRQWLRMARSRFKRIELNRQDAEGFFFSRWYERLAPAIDLDPDIVRDTVFARAIPRETL